MQRKETPAKYQVRKQRNTHEKGMREQAKQTFDIACQHKRFNWFLK